METTQTYEDHPTAETVWALLREVSQNLKETDRLFREGQKETDRRMKEFDKRFGDWTNRFGDVVEYMIAPNMLEKFNELGLDFLTVSNDFKVSDPKNNIYFEIDVKLDNSDKMMLVEIKTKLTTEDVKEHCRRLEKMRISDDSHGHKRTLLGAVAGVVITPFVKEYALKQGFYVVQPSGETFNITVPEGAYSPREW